MRRQPTGMINSKGHFMQVFDSGVKVNKLLYCSKAFCNDKEGSDERCVPIEDHVS